MLVAGFQGVSHRQGRHHARPRRLRHHRRRARRRARTPRCARSTPTSPACSPPTRGSSPTPASSPVVSLRGDARDGGLRRRRAAAALGRVRPQPRRPHPLPIELQRGPRYLRRRRGRDHGTTTDHRRHPLDRRGAHHAPRRPGQPGRRRPHLHRARRRERQRRHDHPERAGVRGRVGRHVVHRPARRPPDRPQGARPRRLATSASSGSPRTRRWARCRSSAPE